MPPGTEQALQAASQRGYEAILLVLSFLGVASALGLILRQLWQDHRALNAFVRETMAKALADNTRAMRRMVAVFRRRPCLQDLDTEMDEDDTPKEAA